MIEIRFEKELGMNFHYFIFEVKNIKIRILKWKKKKGINGLSRLISELVA